MSLWPLVTTIFFIVSGGAYGIEDLVSASGPGMAILMVLFVPFVWAVPAALMTAELASAFPAVGGYYVWVKKGLGPFWGFQAGWWTWLYTLVDNAIYPVFFAEYLATLARILGFDWFERYSWLSWVVSMCGMWPFVILNIRGTKVVGESSVLFSVIVLFPLVLLGGAGVIYGLQHGWHLNELPFTSSNSSPLGAFGLGLYVAMWNYLGWDSISTLGDEVENPQVNYPRALIRAVILVTGSYLIPITAGLVISGNDWSRWEAGMFPEIGAKAAGPWLAIILTLGAVASALGQFNANLLAASRVPFVLSHDGFLPARFRKVHPTFGTPVSSIMISAVIYSILCIFSFQELLVMDVLLYTAALILKFGSLVALRIHQPHLERPYRVPGGSFGLGAVVVLPIALLILSFVGLWFESGGRMILFGSVILLTGPLLYKPLRTRFGQE